MRVLVTGGCGFIGSNLIRWLLRERPDWQIVCLDKLTYAGSGQNLADVASDSRFELVHGDIGDRALLAKVFGRTIDAVFHLAAETHVDRSILGPDVFVQTNVVGTQALLEAARSGAVRRFVHVSTDEVYGSLGATGVFTETSALAPSSPYAASKAAADLIAGAYHATFGVDVVVTRCSNNFGPYQFPEKLIPLMIIQAMRDQELPVYGDGQNVRDWIHVDDHAAALVAALERGKAGETYNIGAANESTNLEIVHAILEILGKPRSLVRFVKDRPAHDRRYATDAAKARQTLQWQPQQSFRDALAKTVAWYVANRKWWERLLGEDYRQYFRAQYGDGTAQEPA